MKRISKKLIDIHGAKISKIAPGDTILEAIANDIIEGLSDGQDYNEEDLNEAVNEYANEFILRDLEDLVREKILEAMSAVYDEEPDDGFEMSEAEIEDYNDACDNEEALEYSGFSLVKDEDL